MLLPTGQKASGEKLIKFWRPHPAHKVSFLTDEFTEKQQQKKFWTLLNCFQKVFFPFHTFYDFWENENRKEKFFQSNSICSSSSKKIAIVFLCT